MSISGSLNNALSGLTVASRSAELVSANIANAMTEGYGRRALSVTGAAVTGEGQGARVLGVDRVVNQAAIGDRRLADAESGYSGAKAAYFRDLEFAIGIPDDPSSLSGRIAEFEAALVAASANPENVAKLNRVVYAASDVSDKFNAISDQIKSLRQQADAEIAASVSRLNAGLQNLDEINDRIVRLRATGADVSGLMDDRQVEIDRISDLVPVREVPKPDGRISLITQNGATLLETGAASIGFTPTALIEPHMTRAGGLLGELTLNGAASMPGDADFSLKGGKLEALFVVRDELSVSAQSQLDAMARELMARFEDASVDPSITAGQPGLFTDAGLAFDALAETGLAGRLRISAVVDPGVGGDVAALRDGIYAAPGPVGDPTILIAMSNALSDESVPATGNFSTAGTMSRLFTGYLSETSQYLLQEEARLATTTARVTAFNEIAAQEAVNTDEEMQQLLLVEQLYAANARVIQTVDELIQQLLRL